MTQVYKTNKKQRCDIKGCRKKATHKMRVASTATKRISHLYYCTFHFADLYSGIFMGENLVDKKK